MILLKIHKNFKTEYWKKVWFEIIIRKWKINPTWIMLSFPVTNNNVRFFFKNFRMFIISISNSFIFYFNLTLSLMRLFWRVNSCSHSLTKIKLSTYIIWTLSHLSNILIPYSLLIQNKVQILYTITNSLKAWTIICSLLSYYFNL